MQKTPSALQNVAIRRDPDTGATEEVAFFGPSAGRLFGCLHLPAGRPTAGVLVCCSVASEFEKNYRREAVLGWELAARGIAAYRFHYRGAGHSDGRAEEISLRTMTEDAAGALEELKERAGIATVGFLGTRLGSLVAAATASTHPGAPMALWDPVREGDRYFTEAFRASFIGRMREGAPGTRPPARDELINELHRAGRVDVLGHTIGRPLYESVAGRRLDELLGAAPRSVLVVRFGRGSRPDDEGLTAAWRRAGWDVHVADSDEMEPWWFGDHKRGRQATTRRTADWFVEQLEQAR
jgi:pimeloyl-ACP methyl ester carboxylesterase